MKLKINNSMNIFLIHVKRKITDKLYNLKFYIIYSFSILLKCGNVRNRKVYVMVI